MTETEIVELISQTDANQVDLNLNDITQIFIKHLATMSERLSREDLTAMLTIAALLYNKGYEEFRQKLGEDAELEAIIKLKE